MCGVLFSEITGATGDGIEAGAMNTMLIISAQREDEDSATRLCADLEEGGYGDWYLPSKDELDLMWKNLYRFSCPNVAPDSSPCPTALGGFAASIYWSSSEFDHTNVWRQDFFFGDQFASIKGLTGRVRAIRAF